MIDAYWFQKKWGTEMRPTINDENKQRIEELEEKYNSLLLNVKRLEEENIETSNVLYELMENIRAVDSRIDILAEHFGKNDNV